MKVYFITRFSILLDKESANGLFKIAKKNSYEQYKKKLFSSERMYLKMLFFQKVAFPSIVFQSNKNWEWHIYCSKELCSKPSLRVDDVINKMIENNLSTKGLFCNGIEDGTRPCGGFFEVNAIGDKN